jgi:hypothetical protein
MDITLQFNITKAVIIIQRQLLSKLATNIMEEMKDTVMMNPTIIITIHHTNSNMESKTLTLATTRATGNIVMEMS